MRRAAPHPKKSGTMMIRRRASDNVYLHKDFHGALNQALIYIEERFGAEAVREYLREFARTFYGPLTADLRERGLEALRAHFARIYGLEGAPFSVSVSPDELVLSVPACPAVARIRDMGLRVSPSFIETTRTLHAAVCEGTGYCYELLEYEPQTGRSVERFSRRRA